MQENGSNRGKEEDEQQRSNRKEEENAQFSPGFSCENCFFCWRGDGEEEQRSNSSYSDLQECREEEACEYTGKDEIIKIQNFGPLEDSAKQDSWESRF
jgi:hypothetical protein